MAALAKVLESASAVTQITCTQTGANSAHCTGTGVDGGPTTTDVTITGSGQFGFQLVGMGWTAPR
jgi:hypothetical protein